MSAKEFSASMFELLHRIKHEGWVDPFYCHQGTLRALFDRRLVVAGLGRSQGYRDGPWVRLRRNKHEYHNRHLTRV